MPYDPTTMTVTEDEAPDVTCRQCGAAVYWGDCYAANGDQSRALFNAANKRRHVCDLDDSDFGVVPE